MTEQNIKRTVLDGVHFEESGPLDASWLIGSTRPDYLQMLPGTDEPDRETLERLAKEGIFVERKPAAPSKLAVMCCGQGSVWPGMGRELYDSFPEARAAMDRIAACSNWDVLALMDERDMETLGQTRWQQPYLFLLEYAQWSLYLARGLKPDLILGHSLGELIALCLAGVYSPETGWYIMETRSRHMQDLEEKSRRDSGMMAVYAGMDVVDELRATWPDLYISNYNTPEQFILSGPRDVLIEARKHLRKKRVAAVVLNITLAFHHPSMRVLRDLDWRRLMCLDMRPAQTPILSCVTADFYPDRQADICASIMDLDENSVRWIQCVEAMRDRFRIGHYLELGPADTLCSMVEKNEPSALCLSSSLRGHERDHVRRTLARLYALGHLPHKTLREIQKARTGEKEPGSDYMERAFEVALADLPEEAKAPEEAADAAHGTKTDAGAHAAGAQAAGVPVLREILARACGKKPEELRASMDLRFDLALRSSLFPALIAEMQEAAGCEISFESLLKVSTVGDLERLFVDGELASDEGGVREPMGRPRFRPFVACCVREEDGTFREVPRNPCLRLLEQSPDFHVGVCATDDEVFSSLVRGLASWRGSFTLTSSLPRTRAVIESLGSTVRHDEASYTALLGAKSDLILWQATGNDFDIYLSQFDKNLCDRVLLLTRGDPLFSDMEELKSLCDRGSALGIHVTALVVDKNIDHASLTVSESLAEMVLSPRMGIFFWKWVDKEDMPDIRLLEQPLLDDADASPFVFPSRHPCHSRLTPMRVFEAQVSAEVFPSILLRPPDETGDQAMTLGMQLEAQREAAMLSRPGLEATGFTDVRVGGMVHVTPGIVREARLVTDIRPWMRHEGIPVRMCNVSTSFRGLGRQGRRTPHYEHVLESAVILAGAMDPIEPVWSGTPDQGRPLDAARFYGDAPAEGRLVESVHLAEDHRLFGTLNKDAFLALLRLWPYTEKPDWRTRRKLVCEGREYLLTFEALLHAAALANELDPPKTPCERNPSFVGYIRFGRAGVTHPLSFVLGRSWDRDRVVRYDAQVQNAEGQCLVTVHHLEYNALPDEEVCQVKCQVECRERV